MKYQEKTVSLFQAYCIPTVSGEFSHINSLFSSGYKFSLVSILVFCLCSICCSLELFNVDIMQLKLILESMDMTISFLIGVSEHF